jgi:uncharacterized membrane protein YhaH (DUF805 family)
MGQTGALKYAPALLCLISNHAWRGKMDWYLMVWKRYADFSGRSRRKEYWMFALYNFLIVFALALVAAIGMAFIFHVNGNEWSDWNGSSIVIAVMLFTPLGLYFLALIIPGIAVAVRRFHDSGKSGWLLLLIIVLGIIPFIGLIASIIRIVIMCLDSDPGVNQYGPSPKYSELAGMTAGYAGYPAMGPDGQPQPFMGESNFGFCKGCGAKFTAAATFCSRCGTHV